MSARKEQDVLPDRPNTHDHAVCSGADLIRRLSSWAAVTEQMPVRAFLANFLGTLAFVLAVVPFHEVAVDLGHSPEAGQFARASRTLQRTGEHLSERNAF